MHSLCCRPPQLLLVRLKRFSCDGSGDSKKISTAVSCPVGPTQLFPKKPKFELSALVSHEGDGNEQGHYTACVKIRREWFKIDDSEVCIEASIESTAGSAYILLFDGKQAGGGGGEKIFFF